MKMAEIPFGIKVERKRLMFLPDDVENIEAGYVIEEREFNRVMNQITEQVHGIMRTKIMED